MSTSDDDTASTLGEDVPLLEVERGNSSVSTFITMNSSNTNQQYDEELMRREEGGEVGENARSNAAVLEGIQQTAGSNISLADDPALAITAVSGAAVVGISSSLLPLPREHSYLPGASHPLHTRLDYNRSWLINNSAIASTATASVASAAPGAAAILVEAEAEAAGGGHDNLASFRASLLSSSKSSLMSSTKHHSHHGTSGGRQSHLYVLAVLELDGLVLFPGATFPIRLNPQIHHHADWIRYLSQQISFSRYNPIKGHVVQLGILPPRLLATNSNDDVTTGTTNSIQPTTATTTQRRQEQQQQTRMRDGQRLSLQERRRSWTRRGYGPARLRRLSERLIQELGDLDELSNVSTDDDDGDDGDNNAQNDMSDNINRDQHDPPRPHINRIRQNSPSSTRDKYGFLGRIGTLATIMYTHGDEHQHHQQANTTTHYAEHRNARNMDNDLLWGPPVRDSTGDPISTQSELVLTAIGTRRFRIVDFANPQEADRINDFQHRVPTWFMQATRDYGDVKHFIIEELDDEISSLSLAHIHRCIPFPRSLSTSAEALYLPTDPESSTTPVHPYGDSSRIGGDALLRNLALITPLPAVVYMSIWPWKLVHLIWESLERIPAWSGLLKALNESSNTDDNGTAILAARLESSTIDISNPVSFSFWLAANLPMSLENKVHVLEMVSCLERLRFLHDLVKREERVESILTCRSCGAPISSTSQVFSVDGAEGTTGNYVNEYGFVHQTITLKSVEEDAIWLQGGPETHNSWFPGYSWTIMACSLCGHHLGWKFDLVTDQYTLHRICNNTSTMNTLTESSWTVPMPTSGRPSFFYGVSAANVTTYVPVHHRRRRHRPQHRDPNHGNNSNQLQPLPQQQQVVQQPAGGIREQDQGQGGDNRRRFFAFRR